MAVEAGSAAALERRQLFQQAVSAVMPVAVFALRQCFTAGPEVLVQSAVRRDFTPAALVRLR